MRGREAALNRCQANKTGMSDDKVTTIVVTKLEGLQQDGRLSTLFRLALVAHGRVSRPQISRHLRGQIGLGKALCKSRSCKHER